MTANPIYYKGGVLNFQSMCNENRLYEQISLHFITFYQYISVRDAAGIIG